MNASFRFYIFTSFLTLAACNGANHDFSLVSEEQTFQQNSQEVIQRKVDILWVIDNSGSMAPFQQSLANNFQEFMQAFVQNNYDFHLAVTTTDAYLSGPQFRNDPSFSEFRDGNSGNRTGFPIIDNTTPDLIRNFTANALQGARGAGDERAFSSLRTALESPANAAFLRPGSFLAVIILSDEDDFSNPNRPERNNSNSGTNPDQDYTAPGLEPVSAYVSFLDQLTKSKGHNERNYNVSVIGVLDEACLKQHQAQTSGTIMGRRMLEIANQTGGVTGSICSVSYSAVLKSIQKRIIELSTEFKLNRRPQPGSIRVSVNGLQLAENAENGWTYNPTSNSILFHGTGIPPKAASVSVTYDPAEALKPTPNEHLTHSLF